MYSKSAKAGFVQKINLVTTFGLFVLIFNLVGAASGNSLRTGIPSLIFPRYSEQNLTTLPQSSSTPILFSPQLIWQQLEFLNPPPSRIGSSFVLNPINRIALLFGGISYSGGLLNDLWITDGMVWMQFQTPHSPEKRSRASMAYDDALQCAILFGGFSSSSLLGDTWVFNGADWIQKHPLVSPSPRANANMAYDANHELIVLYGGQVDSGQNYFETSNETWIWDGINWQQITSENAPPPRWGSNMVYDSSRKSILLFGGGVGGGYYDDTWLWDGASWVEMHPLHHPDGRADFGMAFDESRQQVILFGGQSFAYVDTTETWAWDGQDWIQLHTLKSPPKNLTYGAQLAYIPDLKAVMLYNAFRQKSETDDNMFNDISSIWVLNSRYLLYLPVIGK
jgi:hypothetical protein